MPDLLTHALVGGTVAKAGWGQRLSRPALAAVVAGAVLPDLDTLPAFWDPMAALKYHRTLTHSLTGGLLIALPLAWVIWRVGKEKRYWSLAGFAYLGTLLHIAADLPTAFGVMIFYPWSRDRVAFGWMSSLDPMYTANLVVSWILGWRWRGRVTRLARVGLLALGLYLAVTLIAQASARTQLTQALAEGVAATAKVWAVPRVGSPLLWYGIVRRPDGIITANLRLFPPSTVVEMVYPPSWPIPFLDRALASEEGRLFSAFAQAAVARYWREGELHVIELEDLRFRSNPWGHTAVLRLKMDVRGDVKDIAFSHRF